MLNAVKIIKALEATPSRIDKEQILTQAFKEGERDFFTGAILAYDKLISFGVAKVPEIEEDDGVAGTFRATDFLALVGKLRRRELTGHAARDAILDAIEIADFNDWNYFYRRILLRDLRVGVQPSTINKVLGKLVTVYPDAARYIVPVFSPQLAQDGMDDKNTKHLRGRKYLDLKLDGTRFVAELNKELNTVTLYTRHGEPKLNFPHINEALAKLLPHIPVSIALDGEMIARSFSELMEQLNRKDAKTTKMKFAMFDLVPLVDFRAGRCELTQRERHEMLVALATTDFFKAAVVPEDITDGDMIYVLPKVEVDLDTEEGQETLAEMRRKAKADRDSGKKKTSEGVMVKGIDDPYQNGWNPHTLRMEDRPTHWLKLKPTVSATLTVVEIERGKPDGKYANTLGNLICEGNSDCGKSVRVRCGGGLKDWMREEWWADPTKIIGWIVEIEADDFSLAKGATTHAMRFPRLKERRGTKPGEKL